jgi:ABC-type antimicrobial peptide transport system permease subunit
VIVISETLARRLWPGAEPLGRVLAIAAAPGSEAFVEYCVVGVARDVRDDFIHPHPEFAYAPLATEGGVISNLFLRPRSEAATSLAAIASSVEGPGVKLNFHRWTATQVQERLLPYLGLAALSGALGGLALLLACVGLYGVMSFSVRQRTREIGIRVALGANTGRIVRMFLRQGMRLVAWGVAIGLGGSALLFLLLTKFWFGLALRLDVLALGVVTLLLSAVALLACWLPAQRAAKVDPMIALRAE